MKESTLVRNIRKAVKAKYPFALFFKWEAKTRRGVPDVWILFPREVKGVSLQQIGVLVVETKAPKVGRLTKLQEHEINQIRCVVLDSGGCWAFSTDNVADVLEAMDNMGAVV